MPPQQKENLQTRTKNGLAELGEKIFLDRYAIKDAKKETLAVGDVVVVCVNLKTGQREIGMVEKLDLETRELSPNKCLTASRATSRPWKPPPNFRPNGKGAFGN